ncbi:MAG: branched-chain amino acid ABC transporter ATP-binding protein/permease [Candidatus Rokubacteria bacterium]|nr:branched-chain amino acid ABC transporter ATP-binding protein/permease [Candidatus Rokubacteria bacterium]
MEFWLHVVNSILLFTMLGFSLNLLLGYTGLVSMFHAGLYGVGAYAAALSAKALGVPFPWTILVAVIMTTILAGAVTLPALRVHGEYLILLTLAFQMVIYGLMVSWVDLTQGRTGVSGIPRPNAFGLQLTTPAQFLPLMAMAALVTFLIAYRIGESPLGRVLKAIRDDERATLAAGKSVLRFKVLVFSVSGGLAGVASALLAHYHTFINPFSFSLDRSIFLVALVVLGGTANLLGTVVGATLFVGLPEILRFLEARREIVDAIRSLIFGMLLVLFMRFRPEGILPESLRIRRRAHAPPERGPAPAVALATRPVREDAGAALRAQGLRKSFGGIKAADNLTLTLTPGKVTALVGPNGAGKTTVFNLITGFLPLEAGAVVLHGRDATGLPPWQRVHLGLARTFQDVRLFERLSVIDNVLLSIPEQAGERLGPLFFAPGRVARAERENRWKALSYLDFVGLRDKAEELAASLAFGEQKLVALARLLATEADVLLLDEPAAGVDAQWVGRILDLIRRLAALGKTVCIVEHNLEVVTAIADHAYFMEAGRIIAEGRPEELMADRRLAEIYFGKVLRWPPGPTFWSFETSPPATSASRSSSTSRSRSAPARSSPSWVTTAPGRPPRSRRSSGCCRRGVAKSASMGV